jgi:hypothetical protein
MFMCSFLAGAIPSGPADEDRLVPLTMVEENLLSLHRAFRLVYVMKPASGGYDRSTRQLCHRAHVVAVPNAGADKIRDCLLPRIHDIGEFMDVVFLSLVDVNNESEAKAAIKRMAERSPALHIRGVEVVKWAKHLSKVR